MIVKQKMRAALTLLEVVFVIVILGIVASIGSEIIVKVYENYILQRAQHRSSIKTELVAVQVANRLRYAIPGTVIRRQGLTSPASQAEELSTAMSYASDSYKILQWVAYDGDSFEAIDPTSGTGRLPGWSGFCDLNTSDGDTIETPGSRLTLTNTIIANLSKITAPKTIADAVLYFPQNPISNISGIVGNETINLDANTSRIVEHYKLAWTSYALVALKNDGSGNPCPLSGEPCDLYLYYNFSPTYAATIGGTRSLLLKNVTNFKFQGAGRTIRFKVCKEERITDDVNVSTCKEKAVF